MVYGTSGGVQVILPGTQDQALAMAGGVPTWVSTLLPPGTTLPINQPGDLVVGAVGTGLPARLAVGPPGSVLSVGEPGQVFWSPAAEVSGVGPGGGQGRLRVEGTNLLLFPYLGNQLWIGDRTRTIPDAGVALGSGGLTVNTNYYIYAAWVSNAMWLEASTTGPTQIGGYYHKTGDTSRALVGFTRVFDIGAGPAWVDTPRFRFVLGLHNQDTLEGGAFFTAPRTTTSTTPVELEPEIRSHFLAWAPASVVMGLQGVALANTTGTVFNSLLTLDGVPVSGVHVGGAPAGNVTNVATSVTRSDLAEGFHTISLYGQVNTGTATWHGEAAGVLSCRTYFLITV
jgi:hypothetical protein